MIRTNQEKEGALHLRNAPIVEAILDIDCDTPPDFDFERAVNDAASSFKRSYPVQRARRFTEHQIKQDGATNPQVSVKEGVDAFQFFTEDEKQLVQLRRQGFSFNRLTPYTSLDDYLREMERTWTTYVGVVQPVMVRAIRLRYINRIILPLEDGGIDLDRYLQVGPRTPAGSRLSLSNFINRNSVLDRETGHQAAVMLASEQPEANKLPLIFDITTTCVSAPDSLEWRDIEPILQSLRELKNYLFQGALTDDCLELFQ